MKYLMLILFVLTFCVNAEEPYSAEWKHYPEGLALVVSHHPEKSPPDSVYFFADDYLFGASYWTGENYETYWNNPEGGVYYVKANMYVTQPIGNVEMIESPARHFSYQEPEDTLGRVFRTGEFVPELVVLKEPEHEATNVALNVTLVWEETGYADQYQVQFAEGDARNNPDVFTEPLYDEIIETTEYQVEGLKQGTWYSWRVRAGNHVGWGEWSGNF